MSTLAFMKILESSPSRYDRGIKYITLGKVPGVYVELAENVSTDMMVLDIGCGTGLFSLLAAKRGAVVKGIDINPEMLSIAKGREGGKGLDVTFEEKGVAELDSEPEGTYDLIFAGLVFSELEGYEQNFTLKQIKRILKPNGKFILIDEVSPSSVFKRIIQQIVRLPVVLVTYILTQTSTRSVKRLPQMLKTSRFKIIESKTYLLSSLAYFICVPEVDR